MEALFIPNISHSSPTDIFLVSQKSAQSFGDYLSHQQNGTQHRNHYRVKIKETGRE